MKSSNLVSENEKQNKTKITTTIYMKMFSVVFYKQLCNNKNNIVSYNRELLNVVGLKSFCLRIYCLEIKRSCRTGP